MKAKYLYIISVLALCSVACSQEFQNIASPLDSTMSFKVISPNAHTRVSHGLFEAEDTIGIYVTDYINDETPALLQVSGNRANNEALISNADNWISERPIYWGDRKVDVYAYYPYMDVADVDEHPFSIATDQDAEGGYETSDLLWAKAEGVTQTNGAVQLEMKHIMSRLVVKIIAGKDYKGSLPKDATVYLHSTVTDTRVALATGSVGKAPYAGPKSIKMHNLGIRSVEEGEAVVYEAIVVPQMLLGTVPLVEINSKSVSYLLEDSFNFKPGTSYTYTIVLNSSTTSIKIDIGCETDDWNNIGEGSEDDEGGDEDSINLSDYTDLSAEGTANCYLVKGNGNYKFKAVLGNSNIAVGNVKMVDVIWETFGTDIKPNEGDLIATTGYQNGYIYFTTAENFNNGNASIAAHNSKGTILWSWHIWCSEEGWIDHIYANDAGTMMDRNLGATSATPGNVGAYGLFYQWGRKDPFIGVSSISNKTFAASTCKWGYDDSNNNIMFAESNPTIFINGSWNGCIEQGGGWSTSEFTKSKYDPCPFGYRVPNGGDSGFWKTAYVKMYVDKINPGIYFTLADEEKQAWYPQGGRIDSNMQLNNHTEGLYWDVDPEWPSSSLVEYCFSIYEMNGAQFYFHKQLPKRNALFIRCVKE